MCASFERELALYAHGAPNVVIPYVSCTFIENMPLRANIPIQLALKLK
jgi:hypothetical protein